MSTINPKLSLPKRRTDKRGQIGGKGGEKEEKKNTFNFILHSKCGVAAGKEVASLQPLFP